MSRLELPLKADILTQTGDLLLQGILGLHVQDDSGQWRMLAFRADSGSDIRAIPAWYAKSLNLPMPTASFSIPINTSTGQEMILVRSGTLRIKVDGLGPRVFDVPCHFRGDPGVSPAPGSHTALFPRRLLGVAGVIDKLRIYPDGSLTSLAAPFGVLVVEEI